MMTLVALAAVLRLYGIGWGLPEAYEEAAPLHKAWNIWGWGPAKSLDLNPHFFYYPSLVLYIQFFGQGILYLGMRLFGAIDSAADFQVLHITGKTPLFLAGRFITALFGIAAVAYVYRIGRKIAGLWMAVPAAFLLAVNTLHVSKSQVIEVDVPLVFFMVLALWFVINLLESPTRRNYLLAGVSIGLATSSKYPGAFLGLSLIAAHLIVRRERARSSGGRKKAKKEIPPWRLLALSITAAAAAFLVTSPFIILDFPTFWKHFSTERIHMEIGHFGLDESITWSFYLEALGRRILGWPAAVLTFAGFVYFAAYRKLHWALVLAAFFVPFLIAISSWSMRVDRYVMPLVPVALLVAGGAIAECADVRRTARVAVPWRLAVAALAVLLLAAPIFASYPDHLLRMRKDTRTEAREWIEENIPSGSFVATEMYGPELFGPHLISMLEEDVRQRVIERMKGVPNYAVQPIPMYSLKPERAEVFYDLSLYEIADVVVTSSMVKSRYLKEPLRFRRQITFYEDLEREFQVIEEFVPRGSPGPTLTVYRNPRHRVPFGRRGSVEPPRPFSHGRETSSGSEELFLKNLGVNYEVFGYYREALAAYDLAFQYPLIRPEVYNLLVLRKTLCLLSLDRPQEAVDFLSAASTAAHTPAAREYFGRMRRRILGRMKNKQR
jgi:4-amino-4-deoxy-L-arabinose transferase-like glycosyltransferase